MPDNKYGLGSAKVANEHHHSHQKSAGLACKYCGSLDMSPSATMHDHLCNECGEWQSDVPQGYSTGRSSDY